MSVELAHCVFCRFVQFLSGWLLEVNQASQGGSGAVLKKKSGVR